MQKKFNILRVSVTEGTEKGNNGKRPTEATASADYAARPGPQPNPKLEISNKSEIRSTKSEGNSNREDAKCPSLQGPKRSQTANLKSQSRARGVEQTDAATVS